MNGFVVLFAVDFAKIDNHLNNRSGAALTGCPSMAVADGSRKLKGAPLT